MTVQVKRREFPTDDGIRLVADCRGDPNGPPVVFSHGGGQTRHSWGGAAETLARRGWYTVSYDHRGHGESDWDPRGTYRFDTFTRDLIAVLDQLDGPAHLVGASLGGLSAMVAVGEAGVAAASIVLVDVTPRMNPEGVQGIQAFMERNADTGFASLGDAAEAVAAYTGRPMRDDHSGLKKNLRYRDGRWYWHWDPRILALHDEHQMVPQERFEQALQNVGVPLMLVRGKSSDVVTAEEARAFRELVPEAEYVDVEQARHMVAGDRNDLFTNAVEAFLDKLGAAAGP